MSAREKALRRGIRRAGRVGDRVGAPRGQGDQDRQAHGAADLLDGGEDRRSQPGVLLGGATDRGDGQGGQTQAAAQARDEHTGEHAERVVVVR
ncbi:hypothetical protein GCM10009647_061960 [Streptomyces sanglieri]